MAWRVQNKTINDVLELLVAEGFEGMADEEGAALSKALEDMGSKTRALNF